MPGKLPDDGLEAALALDGRSRTDGALLFDDLAIAAALGSEPCASQLAFEVEVGRNAGHEQRLVGHFDVTVSQEDRDAWRSWLP